MDNDYTYPLIWDCVNSNLINKWTSDTSYLRPVINLKADVTATKLANGHYQVN